MSLHELPNAHHIETILERQRSGKGLWAMTPQELMPTRLKAIPLAVEAVTNQGRSTVFSDVMNVDPSNGPASGACLALIAWDDCGHYMELSPEAFRLLLHVDNYAAVLLYPAFFYRGYHESLVKPT